jgi:hypothetical protein
MTSKLRTLAGTALAVVLISAPPLSTESKVTTPREQFGFDLGDDYQLANYAQLTAYWQTLAGQSDRMQLVEIGRTAEDRPQWMAIVTSPENHRRLARYQEISQRLARAEDLTDEQARALAREGRAVVWVDGGLHATETLGAQQLMELVHQMVSRNDAETQRILGDVILLAVHANPDGHDLVADWYMREADPSKRSLSGLPRLYQKYIGHDNNRDFYISNMPETANMNRILYREWFPQIVYNHHQTGPTGTVLFAPPFRDPFNYVFDPLVPVQLDLVGAAMHQRFVAEGKPGATMRRGANYSTWWNGGLRTTTYFHNMIGLLTETIGSPTPMEIPFVPQRLLPSSDLPFPIAPQKWHFRQSIEYSITANRAVLDVASRYREDFLFNIYRMGRNSIERGSRDSWTTTPRRLAALGDLIASEGHGDESGFNPAASVGGFSSTAPTRYFDRLRDPADRDARAYIVPSDQPDFLTATKFVNALITTGVVVHRATAAFEAGRTRYPAGSYIVKTAQAFRPHVLDMFEPQDHPHDLQYPGGPPIPPYDSAGWTLAFQMGVRFDRLLDDVTGPFERLPDVVTPPPGSITGVAEPTGYLVSHAVNDAFLAVNRLLAAGDTVFWMGPGSDGGPAVMYVPAGASTRAVLDRLTHERGLSFEGVPAPPPGEALEVRPVRLGLWDRYGGSMPSGWVRWLLEQFEFPYEVVFPQALDAGNLRARFDVLLFPDGAIPERDGLAPRRGAAQPEPSTIPERYRGWLGTVTVAETVPQLRAFLEQGGTILTIGSSAHLATHLGAPFSSALLERTSSGTRPLPRDLYYVPGSVLRMAVDPGHPLAYGLDRQVDVFFDNSPAFRLPPNAAASGVRAVAWFDTPAPLRSGWAWGEHHLEGAAAIVDAAVGGGRLVVFGPEIVFRAQPHGTFRFLFNGIYYGTARPGRPARAGGGTSQP